VTAACSALAQGPDVPTTVPIPNSGQEQVEPGGGKLRIRQLPESVWQVAPMTGVGRGKLSPGLATAKKKNDRRAGGSIPSHLIASY